MTKQGVPWLEIVLRENENEKDVIVGGRVKSGEKMEAMEVRESKVE